MLYIPGNTTRYSYDPVTTVRTELESSDELTSRKYMILYAYEDISHLSDYAIGIASNGSALKVIFISPLALIQII